MWIYGDDAYDHYFGFDLGDGESAVAWLRPGSSAEPQLVELRGRKSVLSVVGVHPERGVLIGEEALYASGLTELHARFKSRFLSEPDEAGRVLALYRCRSLPTGVRRRPRAVLGPGAADARVSRRYRRERCSAAR